MKKCSICQKEKDIDKFPYQNKKFSKRMSACKECSSKKQKEYRIKNSSKIKRRDRLNYQKSKSHRVEYARNYRKKYPEKTRATNWKSKYGITPEQFYLKLKEQKNKCAICKRDMNEYGKIFSVDHNHSTNKIRGLLCDPCNYGLGFYEKHRDKYMNYLLKFD